SRGSTRARRPERSRRLAVRSPSNAAAPPHKAAAPLRSRAHSPPHTQESELSKNDRSSGPPARCAQGFERLAGGDWRPRLPASRRLNERRRDRSEARYVSPISEGVKASTTRFFRADRLGPNS